MKRLTGFHDLGGLLELPQIAPGASFSPLSVPGLVLWLKADAGTWQNSGMTTPAAADSDPVGGWTDQSGAGNHYTQGTSSKKPILKTALQNGKNVIRGDGVDDFLHAAGLVCPTSNFALYLVWRNLGTVGRPFGEAGNVSDGSHGLGLFTNVNNGYTISRNSGANNDINPTNTPAQNVWGLYELVFDGSGSTVYLNAVSRGTSTGTAWSRGTLTTDQLFAAGDNTQAANVDVGEVAIFNAAPSAGNRSLLEAYFNTRFAIY